MAALGSRISCPGPHVCNQRCSTGLSLLPSRTRPNRRWQRARAPQITRAQDDSSPSDAEVVPLTTFPASRASAPGSRWEGLTAVVAGATGGTGRALVSRLLAEGVPTTALVRNPADAASRLPRMQSNLRVVKGDVYQLATLPPAVEGSNVMIIATGTRPALDPLGPFSVDYQGTLNLVAVAKQKGIKHIVLVSSIGVDDLFFPLNLFFGVLFFKKRAEEELQRSGITYTIVRPGGLQDTLREGQTRPGGIVMRGPDAFGLPPRATPGGILRSQVADVCVEALVEPAARDKVVEVIANSETPLLPMSQLFQGVVI
ncbi:hypothetical protein WJX74_005949 [Apatococcus lobatus]|uniref:NAD(P)-binding domain-containing protein n=1 Tax=Apatococcus lobatus TaxID=904363 RepID=A0AAW1S3Q3_9CHLO